MAKIGNEAKLVLKLAEERIGKLNADDNRELAFLKDEAKRPAIQARIRGREESLATLKSIHLELQEE